MIDGFLLGPGGQVAKMAGARGVTPEVPDAKFKIGEEVRLTPKLTKQFGVEGKRLGIGAVVPAGFSPDWALADAMGEPRPLMCEVNRYRDTSYLVGIDADDIGDGKPRTFWLREKLLRKVVR